MINILIPIAGKSKFFDSADYPFPKPFIEVVGKTMIEEVLENFKKLKMEKKFIFVINQNDSDKYHLDNALKLLTDNNCKIIELKEETKGAVCSCLMAIEQINNQDTLIISNGDQVIDTDFNKVVGSFEKKNVDAGVVCFNAIHPKWSYVRLDENSKIIETAEKNSISRNAIAGFYYFKNGCDFVRAAMKSIEKDASVNGLYYIAPTYNELVIENKNLEILSIDSSKYHSFYSPQKIKEYEDYINIKRSKKE